MKLLFITQKLHGQDAFGILWVREFIRQGFDVEVVCLEDRVSPLEFPVHSMGKEKGHGRFRQIFEFQKLITTLHYDRVFIHMSPVWGLFGAWWWILTRTPVYLWYTHYKMQAGLWLLGFYGKRLFCATPQSLPQYEGSPKKVVVGHGIDMSVWPKRPNHTANPHALLAVHRLSRSKRVELGIRALTLLPESYMLTVYGIEAEKDYVAELKHLVSELHLEHCVTFMGSIPMEKLPEVYASHRLIVNMASETIDKTMLEAMTCGCYPVTTARNAQAIGIRQAPAEDTPESVAHFIEHFGGEDPDILYAVVKEKHSLEGLVRKMGEYVREGK